MSLLVVHYRKSFWVPLGCDNLFDVKNIKNIKRVSIQAKCQITQRAEQKMEKKMTRFKLAIQPVHAVWQCSISTEVEGQFVFIVDHHFSCPPGLCIISWWGDSHTEVEEALNMQKNFCQGQGSSWRIQNYIIRRTVISTYSNVLLRRTDTSSKWLTALCYLLIPIPSQGKH